VASGRVPRLLARLRRMYPEARTALVWRTPFELLCATVLSAQSTDRMVNRLTPALFARFPDPAAMAAADPAGDEDPGNPDGIAHYIRQLGLYRTKARHLRQLAQILMERFRGQVPRDRAALESLPGVGRKTANVVLANAFGEPALAVDTHVARVARRLGLTLEQDPAKIEADLCAVVPRRDWIWAHHALIAHGREVCHARRPACERCALAPLCPSAGGVDPGLAAPPRAHRDAPVGGAGTLFFPASGGDW